MRKTQTQIICDDKAHAINNNLLGHHVNVAYDHGKGWIVTFTHLTTKERDQLIQNYLKKFD